jgi:O-acetyl-ADP-ribose deacetylase (regulator of RNase III)
MLRIAKGDVLAADAEALVNTVNCVGVMGRGVALQFKRAFPDNFKQYQKACERGEVRPGSMFVVENRELTGPRYIINFPTKRDWKNKSRMEDIDSGLIALVEVLRTRNIRSVAIPPLGCGLGGLDWNEVRPRIERALDALPEIEAIIFEPAGAPAAASEGEPAIPTMTPGRAALLGLMRRYLAGLMDPFISLLEVHKLMYFMQEAGEPLKLDFAKAQYGPYAENLRHVLRRIDGHFISGYADGGDNPAKTIEPLPAAVSAAEAYLADRPEIRARFDRVASLVEGFESSFGLELLATVHWVAKREGASSAEEAIPLVYAWNDRKKRFLPDQIEIAWNTLAAKGWLSVTTA